MLSLISWARFGVIVFVGLAVYYGYVLVRFYGRDLRRLAGAGATGGHKVDNRSWASTGNSGREGVEEVTSEAREGMADGKASDGTQTALYAQEAAGETLELFKVMEKVIILLRQVMTEAAGTGITREEVEARIRSVLAGYRQLRKTPYEEAINQFISRTCATTFSLLLSDAEVEGLWGKIVLKTKKVYEK